MQNYLAQLQVFLNGLEVAKEVRDGFLAARQADSDGGKTITLNEVIEIGYIALLAVTNLTDDRELAEKVKQLKNAEHAKAEKGD